LEPAPSLLPAELASVEAGICELQSKQQRVGGTSYSQLPPVTALLELLVGWHWPKLCADFAAIHSVTVLSHFLGQIL
jgi:hypothetical protein